MGNRFLSRGKRVDNGECLYKTGEDYCVLHSDEVELPEPCVKNWGEPCDDYRSGSIHDTPGELGGEKGEV